MADKTPISDTELQALVASEIESALGTFSSELAAQRAKAMDYYQARPFGNEIEGRSSVVSTDVSDTVEWVMPTLMRMFTGGDQTVEFEPETERDIPFAKQATEYVNFIWNNDNDGFLNFYTLFKDALLQKNGIGKAWWDDSDIPTRERYYGLDDAAYTALVNADDVTVSEHTENEEEIELPPALDPATGQLTPQPGQKITTHDVVVTRKKPGGRVCVAPVPPEYFLISREGWDIQTARMVGDKTRTTISDLREEGVSEELIQKIGVSPDGSRISYEEITRNTVEDNVANIDVEESPNDAMSPLWKTECYIRADVDGDGIAEMRKVVVAGPSHTILSNESWDSARPYFSVTPIIMPHRFWGRSLADLIMDIQLIRSTLWRQFLDNSYANNNQRLEVVESQIIDPSEVLSSRPGGVIRVKTADSVRAIEVPQIGEAMLAGLQYVDQQRENRTGISERTQGLGANSLHDTAHGQQLLMTAAMGKIELIARVFAEGIKQANKLILGLVCRYQNKPRVIQVTKNWVPMDPRSWNENMNVSISVAMGAGDAQQKLQNVLLLGQAQKELFAAGMVTPKNLMATAELMINAMGLKGVDRFFTEPDPNAPPKPDPAMAKVQADAQLGQAKLQSDAQLQQQKIQSDAQVSQVKATMDAKVDQIHQQMEAQREQQKAQTDLMLSRLKMQIDTALELQLAHIKGAVAIEVARIGAKADDGKAAYAKESAGE